MSFGFPLSEYRSARLGLGFDNTAFTLDSNPPQTYSNFEQNYGNSFDTFTITSGWTYDTRDRVIFTDSAN